MWFFKIHPLTLLLVYSPEGGRDRSGQGQEWAETGGQDGG